MVLLLIYVSTRVGVLVGTVYLAVALSYFDSSVNWLSVCFSRLAGFSACARVTIVLVYLG